MLNTNLKLNSKLFDENAEQKATREGFGEGLLQLGEENQNVVALSADLMESTHCHLFAQKFPDRFFEMGVAEQNMAAVAAGLGVSGKTAFIASYATFSPGKNWETVRTTIVYNRSNVKIAGHHSGIMTGPDGATHQATEDIAITRVLPGLDVFVPCDAIEAKKITLAAGRNDHPTYIRFTRDKTPLITTEETPFEVGKMQEFWIPRENNSVVTLFAMGYMNHYALLAAKRLEEEGKNVRVVNVSTIKPLDTDAILRFTQNCVGVVSVEDHQIAGGMGSAIAEVLAQTKPMRMEFVGLRDTFAESGSPSELLTKYHMDTDAIVEAAKKFLI